ncbi:MAG: PKD domain-containing protein [Candidatus Pseudobacter hemicellulosilyticus]|uniref:PKD domain-containing protein n=1 Tax=Candidatus Pseudobacter hemicellulosilyticus TaxID=3121375 RepID=A0AAJ5WV84_9BACT|nr:MAG: PKD domain-containing protein [Pseudobacter sp.]
MRNFLMGLLGVLMTVTAAAQQVATGLTAANGDYLGFYKYTPTDYNSNTSTKYPLIIFLHGGGEKGNGTTELARIATVGGTPPRILADGGNMDFTWNGKKESFIVLSPQCPSKYGWWQNWMVDEIYNYAIKNLRVDPNRIYLTGLSMGGGGTWQYVGSSLANAQKFAAIGISCGACSSGSNFANIANANLPTWAFHAKDDTDVPYTCTVAHVDKIKASNPAVQPYMTLWPDGLHYIWGRVYDQGYTWQNPNLYEWFLGQDKSKPVNKRPTANPGGAQTILTGTGSVTLNAGSSSDADGKIVRYIWSKVSGPNAGAITTPVSTDGKTTVTGLSTAGTYVYNVKVVDDRADWTEASVTITVNSGGANVAPVANAGADQTITLPANTATLNGSGSRDSDGSIASYAWTKVSGPTGGAITSASAVSTTVTGLIAGTYVFRLTVKDNVNATGTDDVTITVKTTADNPLASKVSAGSDQSITLPTNSISLNGSGSTDTRGEIKKYEWAKISGPTAGAITSINAVITTVTGLVEGTYKFRLTIWDNSWTPYSDTIQVIVNKGATVVDRPAIPNAGADITITLPTNSTTLNGSASTDPDGPIQAYRWRWISGPTQHTIANSTAVTTALTNLVEGTYSFELMVWGDTYTPVADTVKVTVKAAAPTTGNQHVIVKAGADITLTLPSNSTTLNGADTYDPDGPVKAWKWRWISGPTTYTIANAAVATTALTNLVAGVYSFELMAWGDTWDPRADTIKVTVLAAGSNNGGTGGTTTGKVANAGADQLLKLPVNSTTLDGSASTDPKGAVKSYEWTKISGAWSVNIASPRSAKTTVSGLAQGITTFRLTVYDNSNIASYDTVSIAVGSGTTKPATIANAGPDIAITLPTNSASLNGSASVDPAGSIKAYQWKYLAGPAKYTIASPTAAISALTNLVEGMYAFELMVWNNSWTPSADTILVVVSAVKTTTTAAAATGMQTLAATAPLEMISVEATVNEQLSLYPNPVKDVLNIKTVSKDNGNSIISVYDATGRLLRKTGFLKSQSTQVQTITVNDLKPGVYHLEVVIDNKTRFTSKFLKH